MHCKKGDFSSVLWRLLVPLLLCNSPSSTYRLVYHKVWIIASPFLQIVKELILPNYFTLYNISLSPYLLTLLCGAVFLVPPPKKLTGSLHYLRTDTQLVDWPPCNIIHNYYPCVQCRLEPVTSITIYCIYPDVGYYQSNFFVSTVLYRMEWYYYFFFWAGLRDPIACSLLGCAVLSQNSGYKVTDSVLIIMLVC